MSGRFAGRKVVITGAGGFVGANLVSALESEDARVFALVRKGTDRHRLQSLKTSAELVEVDLLAFETVQEKMEAIQPEYVFNAAVARDHQKLLETWNMNSMAALNLLHASASPSLQRFVHCGSSLEYGAIGIPFNERDLPKPNSFYGASKAAATLLLQQAAMSEQLPVAILRIFCIYGAYDSPHRLVPKAIRHIKQDKSLRLTNPGYCRDYILVDDVVEALILAALKQGLTEFVFNIASGVQTTNETIVRMIEAIMGKPARISSEQYPAREWDKAEWRADISLARVVLGWKPAHTLEQGLARTVEWVTNHVN